MCFVRTAQVVMVPTFDAGDRAAISSPWQGEISAYYYTRLPNWVLMGLEVVNS